MTIRYGVIGIGGWAGTTHAECVKNHDDAELLACCDIVEDVAKDAAGELGCENWYTSASEMIETEGLDAVSIATPSGTHGELTVESVEAGADVLCEKPLELKRDRLNRMIQAAEREDATLAGVYQFRTAPETRFMKHAVETGMLGEPVLASTALKWFRGEEYYAPDYKGTRDMDGGVLFNQGIHAIDRLQWIMGGVDSVMAHVDNQVHDIEAADTASMSLRFENGALGVIQVSTATGAGVDRTVIDGRRGSIEMDIESDITHFERIEEGEETAMTDPETEHPSVDVSEYAFEYGEGHTGVVGDFIAAVRDDRPPMVPAREARKAIDLNLAVYRSAQTGEAVDPSSIQG